MLPYWINETFLEHELDELHNKLSRVGPDGFRSRQARTFFERKLRLIDAEAELLGNRCPSQGTIGKPPPRV